MIEIEGSIGQESEEERQRREEWEEEMRQMLSGGFETLRERPTEPKEAANSNDVQSQNEQER